MANELIKGLGDGVEEWALPLFQGVDASGNSLWQFDKNGNLTITGVLAYGSIANLNGAVNFAGDFAVATNKFTVAAASGNTIVAGTLAVTGASTLTGAVACGALTVTGAETISTTLGVTGASTLTGNVSCGGTLSVTGTSTQAAINASGTVAAAGALTVGTTLGVTGTSTMAAINSTGTHAVTGAITASTTLGVTGASTLTGAVSCGSTLAVTGTSTQAAINASGTVAAAGALTVGTTLGVTGGFTSGAKVALNCIETALTAHSGGGQPGLALSTTKSVHNVATVAAGNDSLTLPVSAGNGSLHIVMNSAAANSLQVFGTTTDTINGVASGTGVAVAAGKSAIFVDYAAGTWFMLLSA